jgi:hypothetical protein
MNMKALYIQIAALLICSAALAGQVLTLNGGQTLALDNGDVVACISNVTPPSKPIVPVICKLFISGLPPFQGEGTTETDARNLALAQCEGYASGRTFRGFDGQTFDPCINGPSNPFYIGYNCK